MTGKTVSPETAEQTAIGPFLRYAGADGASWHGSVLLVLPAASPAPVLQVWHAAGAAEKSAVASEQIFSHRGAWTFWRFSLALVMAPGAESRYCYSISALLQQEFSFTLPASDALYWNSMFYSCNGLSHDVSTAMREKIRGINPLWEDFEKRHKESPYHVMIGGGDQVYADAVWDECQTLIDWLNTKGKENRRQYPWSDSLEQQVTDFYFNLYCKEWSAPVHKFAMSGIPSINIMDDHDLFDGYGSYPEVLNRSNVFVNVGRIGILYYLLFQHHTNFELAAADGYFGGTEQLKTFNFTRQLGPNTAVVMVDARTERTLDQCVSPASWSMIEDRLMNGLAPTTKHLLFVSGVPVIHPRLEFAEGAIGCFGRTKDSLNKFANKLSKVFPFLKKSIKNAKIALGKTGTFGKLINKFGLPELADDLADHWAAPNHMAERKMMVEMLQRVSKTKSMRVTLIGGDVHCGAMGRFHNLKDQDSTDFRLMYQITSSAIGNVPPPGPVLSSVNYSAGTTHKLNEDTREEQLKPFQKEATLGKRNYCVFNGVAGDSLEFAILAENEEGGPSEPFKLEVPPLLPVASTA